MSDNGRSERINVLLVDDDEDMCELTKTFLSQEDDRISVTSCHGGRGAMDVLQRQSFDAVISDYDMPEVDGLALLSWLRERGDETPFIVFTGRGREAVAMKALNRGANRYLRKGGDASTQFSLLATAVRQEVDQQRVARVVTSLARTLSETRGQAFFEAAVSELAAVLGVAYVIVGVLIDDGRAVEIVAAETPDGLVSGLTYDLDGTPCADVLRQSYCRVPTGVQEAYPEDDILAEWGIDGYIGCPLRSVAGRPIGLLEALDTSELGSELLVEEAFNVFASRIAAELELTRRTEQTDQSTDT